MGRNAAIREGQGRSTYARPLRGLLPRASQ
jgi:hypothetical protein